MKKVFIKIISFIIIFFSIYNISYAEKYQVASKIKIIFSSFTKKLEKKYTEKKEIIFLEKINKKIHFFLDNKKISSKKYKILKDILVLSNEEIFKLNKTIRLKNNSQKILEANIIWELRSKLNKIKTNSISEKFTNSSEIKKIKVSNKFEFTENNKIKKIIFKKYFEVNNKNYSHFTKKRWYILLKENWKNWFIENWKIEEKIPYSNAQKYTKSYIKEGNNYFIDNNIFYSYKFKNFISFEDKYWFYNSDLTDNNFNIKNSILYLWINKKYNFIKNYTKIKLINSDIIYWITDKNIFLKHLINDKLYLTDDTDKLFINLKSEILKLTNWLKKEEKIKNIYNFILSNVSYTTKINLNDKKIFSWILTYKNKSWVCEWYAKLASYSLKFAWIPDADVIRWDVIDAQDFPKIWHAWLKIWDLYYDPTFDDPIGQTETRQFEKYKYFWLPRDLLYANRFNYWVTPNILKSKSLEYRKSFVNQRLSKLSDKYKWKNYLILKWTDFLKSNNIEVWKKIDIESAKKIIPFYEVEEKENWEIIFYKGWNKKNIRKLQFYTVTNDTIEQVFIQVNYKTEWLYLFNWTKKDWSKEWRVWFDVEIR